MSLHKAGRLTYQYAPDLMGGTLVCFLPDGRPIVYPIAKIVKVPTPRFQRMWAGALSECFVKRGAILINERLEEARRKQVEYRRRQSDHGKKGGRRVALPDPQGSSVASPSTRECRQEIFSSSSVVLKEKGNVIAFDGQAAFMRLCVAYPASRVNDSQRVASLFMQTLGDDHEWSANFELMLANLETHKVSHEWAVKRMVPGLEKWLESGRWKRPMEADAAESPKPPTRWANWKPTVNGKVVNE